MVQRYFSETPLSQATSVLLEGAEAQHLTRVMRAQPGDVVELFDGTGWQWTAEIQELSRNNVTLKILDGRQADREPDILLTIAIAIPKGDRQKWMIEKLVELGVRKVIPLITDRAMAQPVEKALIRLRNYVIGSSKQCGRNQLLEIGTAEPFTDLLQRRADHRFIAHPQVTGESVACLNVRDFNVAAGEVLMAIGPEGGFTAEEIQQAAEKQWSMVGLGNRILRTETAATAIAARLLLGL